MEKFHKVNLTTEYKPEWRRFLVGLNLDGPKFFFLKISRKVKILCLFILISRLSTHLLLEQYFWWIPGRLKRVSICLSNFILKIDIRLPVNRSSKKKEKKISIELFLLEVECQKTFLYIIYVFPVIVMKRVASLKKRFEVF